MIACAAHDSFRLKLSGDPSCAEAVSASGAAVARFWENLNKASPGCKMRLFVRTVKVIVRSLWETVNTFSQNDGHLQGSAGAVTVLHTHTRRLDYHPHVHLVMPAGAINKKERCWRSKKCKYLFCHKALAIVFRAKMLEGIRQAGLGIPHCAPSKWVVDCKKVGAGDKALVYLGRYLYRGVIQEKDILCCKNGQITFRYRNGKTE